MNSNELNNYIAEIEKIMPDEIASVNWAIQTVLDMADQTNNIEGFSTDVIVRYAFMCGYNNGYEKGVGK